MHGRPLDVRRVPASSLLAYTCTHDQVGNRARGDRPGGYLDRGQLAVKAALVLTSPYTPMLFMGEEWGASTPFQYFTSHSEPELATAVVEGRRREFGEHGWDASMSRILRIRRRSAGRPFAGTSAPNPSTRDYSSATGNFSNCDATGSN